MPNNLKPGSFSSRNGGKAPGFGVLLIVLTAVLGLSFCGAFVPGYTLFSNDGPLSRLMSECHRLPDSFTGAWQDLNAVGYREGGAAPNVSSGLRWLLHPLWFSRCYALAGLLLLGMGAWCFFNQMKLSWPACLLGGLAAALNSSFLSAACWGVVAHAIAIGMTFFALASLADADSPLRWCRTGLAGFAVGMAVCEGADVGALFSFVVAAFVLWQSWTSGKLRVRSMATGTGRLVLVAVCAATLAAQTMSVLVSTNIEGVVAGGQDERSRQKKWDWATQWSLPKKEALGFIVPGLFGYRGDTPAGGDYWGAVGRSASWEEFLARGKQGDFPSGFIRYGAGGVYTGTPVLLLAVWAAAQSLRRKDSVFSLAERKWLRFWMTIGFVSLLLSFGRHAPFYRIVYALPYLSTVRNPAKFTHIVSFVLVILFAYGVDALWQKYLNRHLAETRSLKVAFHNGWARAAAFDRRWVKGSFAILALALLGWLIYASSRASLESFLQYEGFGETMAKGIAGFSICQVGWFVSFYVLTAGLGCLLMCGAFSGRRAKWGIVWLGLLLVVDLGRSEQPWVVYTNYGEQCASNSIIDRLRDKPWQHRVATFPGWFLDPKFKASFQVSDLLERRQRLIAAYYNIEWLQHPLPYYNVQSLDVVQMRQVPEDMVAFDEAFKPHRPGEVSRVVARRWELTNTRYLIGSTDFLDLLNQQMDPGRARFRILDRFQLVPRPGIVDPTEAEQLMSAPATNGPLALFEFSGALPRAGLYSSWLVMTNREMALKKLTDPNFDPHTTVLVEGNVPVPAQAGTNQTAGMVEIASYAPKEVVLKAQTVTPSILLLNDRFEQHWNATVDGMAAPVLRCNYLMRGLYLNPGPHTIEFRFQPPNRLLWVSVAADCVALLLCGFVVVAEKRSAPRASAPVSAVSKPVPATVARPAGPMPGKAAKAVTESKGRS
jgi:hypothetical protein